MLKTPANKLIDTALILHKAGIGEGMRLADLGCGTLAHFTLPMAAAVGENGLVYAVDVLKKSLENLEKIISQEHIHNIRPVWSNLEIYKATKIESASLDAAFLLNTLYQLKNRKEALREAARMLKNKGKLIIVDWEKTQKIGPKPEMLLNRENLILVLQKMGLSLLDEFKPGPGHFGLIFEKN